MNDAPTTTLAVLTPSSRCLQLTSGSMPRLAITRRVASLTPAGVTVGCRHHLTDPDSVENGTSTDEIAVMIALPEAGRPHDDRTDGGLP